MDLVFEKREEIGVTVYGQKHMVRKPTLGEVEQYQAESKEAGESGAVAVTKKFVESLGLPKTVGDDLQMDHFLELVEALVSPKKKE